MIGVTIGTGENYRFYASEAAKRFERFTGLKAVILDETHIEAFASHPLMQHGTTMAEKSYYLKFFIPEIIQDDICYFDCDYCVVDYWQPDKIFDGRFTAVKDRTKLIFQNDIVHCNIAEYVNAGFYMLSYKNHKDLFAKCRKLGMNAQTKFFDQCILNIFLQLDKVPVRHLDRRFNAMNFEGVLKDFDLKAIHNSSNYIHYKEGTTDKGTSEFKLDTIMMAGLAGNVTVVFEDKKQKNLYLYADGTTSDGDVWFVEQNGRAYICDNYINGLKRVKEIYELP